MYDIKDCFRSQIYYIKNSEVQSLFQLCIRCGCTLQFLPFVNVMVSQFSLFKLDNSYIYIVTVRLLALIKWAFLAETVLICI